MELPSVSVLMPTYKQEHFLPRAIESLMPQTLTEWELIIVDDGSPDETYLQEASYLSDTRVHYYRLECNRGLGFALNYALSLAQAPLIAYLPSDDVYYADHLQSLITCLCHSPQAVLPYSGCDINNWDDLNYPSRIATLAAAGLPMLQYDNTGAIVATQTIARELDIGIFFTTMKQLGEQLENQARMKQLRDNVWIKRKQFTFDYHTDGLIEFFRQVIQQKR